MKPYISAIVQVWWNKRWHAAVVTFVPEAKGGYSDPVHISMFQDAGGVRPMRLVERMDPKHEPIEDEIWWRFAPEVSR